MAGITNRLARLEKFVTDAITNCPGCVRIPALILVPDLITDETPTSAAPEDEFARCEVCGKVRRRPVVRICVPGLPEPMMAKD